MFNLLQACLQQLVEVIGREHNSLLLLLVFKEQLVQSLLPRWSFNCRQPSQPLLLCLGFHPRRSSFLSNLVPVLSQLEG